MPKVDEIPDLYPDDYYTHEKEASNPPQIPRQTISQRMGDFVTRRYVEASYGAEQTPWGAEVIGSLLYLHPPRRVEADAYVMYLRARRGADLLDIGCGDGEFLQRMSSMGWQVKGVEADARAAARARERGVPVHAGTMEEVGLPSEAFDAVTMSYVIEHVAHPKDLLAEAFRVLKPGGQMVLVTPNANSLGHRRFGPAWFPLEPQRLLYVFTVPALHQVALAAGISRPRIWTTIRYANYFMLLSRRVLRTGRSDGMEKDTRLAPRAWARALQLAEWVLCTTGATLGEEIVLTARK